MAWRDCGWRTLLGTCFYDRVSEASALEKLVETGWSVLVTGPRNSGKSELVRYVVKRRVRGKAVWVDAGRLASDERFGDAVEAIGFDIRSLISQLAEATAEHLGLGRFYRLALRLADALRDRIYLVIDEVHLLAGVGALEAIAKQAMLSRRVAFIATSSEGYMMESSLVSRLSGYRVDFLTVAEMDEESFSQLYSEYCSRSPCRVGFEVVEALAGRLPGYIGELADADRETIKRWVSRRAEMLDAALLAAAEATPRGYRGALETAYRILVEGVKVEQPEEHRIAEVLVRYNIAYPVELPRLYRPQLNVYALLLRVMLEEGLEALEAAHRVYRRVVGD